MAEAIIRGGLTAGSLRTDLILASARTPARKAALAAMGVRVMQSPNDVLPMEVAILGARHRDVPALLTEVGPMLEGKLVLSLALGITTRQLQAALPRSRIMRAIPNTPVRVREAMTLMCRGSSATAADFSRAAELFTPLGRIMELPEAQLDTAHAVSGAGPAYLFAFVQALMRAAEESGLPHDVAHEAVLQTVMGASRMLRTGDSPESLIAELEVPEGSTRAGLEVLGRAGLQDLFVEAITSGRVRAEARTTESEGNFRRWLS